MSAVVVEILSTPSRRLPAYMIFEVVCLLPGTVWLYVVAYRKGWVTTVGALLQGAVVAAVSYVVQVAATNGKYWDYFQDKDILVGVRISGVPLEEFFFYPLTINISLLLYLLLCDVIKARRLSDLRVSRRALRWTLGVLALVFAILAAYVFTLRDMTQAVPEVRTWEGIGIPRYMQGTRSYGWCLICLVSLVANAILFYIAELTTALMLRAVLLQAGFVFLIFFMIELLGTGRGWWVYNSQVTSGFWIAGIPLENLGVYFTGVMLPVAIFESTRTLLGESGLP